MIDSSAFQGKKAAYYALGCKLNFSETSTFGKMLEDIRNGVTPNEAFAQNIGTYGQYENAAKYIDPRNE